MDDSSFSRACTSTANLPSKACLPAGPVTVALIGVGGFGRTHLRCLELLQGQGRARLVAVADPSDKLSKEKERLSTQGIRWYGDYREMLAKEKDLQAVQIASPIPLHYEMAMACLDRGLYVQLEKPPVVLIQQLEELIARDTEERISVGFQLIDSIQVQTLKSWIIEGRLGRLRDIRVSACWPRLAWYYARASWAGKMFNQGSPVFDGPATNALSHLIHNIMFLAGPDQPGFAVPVRVRGEFYRVRPIESYDVVALQGEFVDGAVFTASLAHATEQRMPYQIEVRGDRDWARLSEVGQEGTKLLRLESSSGIHPFSPEELEYDANVQAQRNFLDFVSGQTGRPTTRLRDARGFVLTINGGILSSGGVHTVPPHFIRNYGQSGDAGVDLDGLLSLVERSRKEGALFSELGAPWARSTPQIPLEGMRHLALDACC